MQLIMNNHGRHKALKARAWLARHPRCHVHFSPTSCSWLNLVERLSAELTERPVRHGSHTAVPLPLEKPMLDYVDSRNRDLNTLDWTASADLSSAKWKDYLNAFPAQDTS